MAESSGEVVRDLQSSFDRADGDKSSEAMKPIDESFDESMGDLGQGMVALPSTIEEGEEALEEGDEEQQPVDGEQPPGEDQRPSDVAEEMGASGEETAVQPEDEKENFEATLAPGDLPHHSGEEPDAAGPLPNFHPVPTQREQAGPTQALLERIEFGKPTVLTHTATVVGPESPDPASTSKTPRQAGGGFTKQRWQPQHVQEGNKKGAASPMAAVRPQTLVFSEAPTLRAGKSPQRMARTAQMLSQSSLSSGLPGSPTRKPLDVYAIKGMRLAQSEQLKAVARTTQSSGISPNPGITPDIQSLLVPKRAPGTASNAAYAAGARQASAPSIPPQLATSGSRSGAASVPRTAGSPASQVLHATQGLGATSRVNTASAQPPPTTAPGQPEMENLIRASTKFPGTIHLSSQLSAAPLSLLEETLAVPDHVAAWTEDQILQFHLSKGFDPSIKDGFLTDPDFPASVHSLFPDPDHPPPQGPLASEWRRVRGPFYSRFKAPQLRWDARCNNLWFANALGALSFHEDLLLSSFVSEDLGEKGLFTFQFFKHGQWVPVTVDDRIPFEPGQDHPQFLRSDRLEGNNDTWPSLIEKAYAKLRGSYFAMDGEPGTISQALTELTGNPVQRLVLDPMEVRGSEGAGGTEDEDGPSEVEAPHLAWMEQCLHRGDVLVTKLSAPSLLAEGMKSHESGIYYNHAYTILDIQRRSDQPFDAMIKVFNPWRGGAYYRPVVNKKVSDFVEEDSRQATPLDSARPAPAEDQDLELRCFTIHARAFFAIFNRLYRIVHIPPTWQQVTLRGAWFGRTAGGPPALGDQPNGSFCCNPQYRITSRKNCDVIVHVSLRDANLGSGGSGSFDDSLRSGGGTSVRAPRFEVLALASDALDYTRKFLTNPKDLLAHESISEAGGLDLSTQFLLRGGSAAVLVPYTEAPGTDWSFAIRIFASTSIEVEELTAPQAATITGAWEGLTSGGGPEYPTWGSNPQFLIQPVETTKIMVQVEPAEPSKPSHILDDDDDEDDDSLEDSYRFNQSLGLNTSYASNATGRSPGLLEKPVSTVSSHGREPLGEPSRANSNISMPGNPPGSLGYNRTASQSTTHRSAHGVVSRPAKKRQMALYVVRPTELQGGGFGRRLFLSSNLQEVLAQTSYVRLGQQTSLSILLTGGVPVMLAPTIRTPGISGRFKMTVYSQTPLQIFELPPSRTITVPGEWTEVKSGGCDLHKSWKKNPAFILTVRGRGPVQLCVNRADPRTGQALESVGSMGDKGIDRMTGFYVFEAAKPPSRGQGGILPSDAFGPRVFESSFVPTAQVLGEVVLGSAAPETTYYVLVATFSPQQLGKFLLTATAGMEIDLVEYVVKKDDRPKRDSQAGNNPNAPGSGAASSSSNNASSTGQNSGFA